MRKLLLILAGTAVIGTSGGAGLGLPSEHARDLLVSILDDVGAILHSFAGGPDDPKNPVDDRTTLNNDAARLDAAARKAEQLANELVKLQGNPPSSSGR